MASLIGWLAASGARDAAGAVVASGSAWFYEPGSGTTTQDVYADADGTEILTQPVTLDAAGRATVYTIEPVRVLIQDAAGLDVTDADQANVTRAEAVQIDNAGFTDGYLDDALTKLYASTGGTDGMYKESGGATLRTLKSKFAELSISVKDFGAKGDGLTIDTTAIQAAINRVAFLGGGQVYFPPGTYKIDQVLTNATTGVSFAGAGQKSIIQGTSTTLGLFSITAGSFYLRDLYLDSATTTGTGIALSGAAFTQISGVFFNQRFRTCVSLASASSDVIISGCQFSANDADAAARALSITDSSRVRVSGCFLYGGTTGQAIELLGSSSDFTALGSSVSTSYVKFNAALTGTGFRFVGNSFDNGTNPAFVFAGATMPKAFYQAGNGVDGYKGTLLSGATFTPDLGRGSSFTIDCTTTGVANVVAVPTPPPAATDYGVYIDITYYAHAGGALTATSGLAVGYHTTAAASLVDTHRTHFRLRWDPDASVWRECSRADTT